MYVLKDLYWGNISPTERSIRPGSDYKKISLEICKQLSLFLETLAPEEKKQLEAIDVLRNEMATMAEEDAFVYGFRLRARMIMGVVGRVQGTVC